MKKKLLSLLTVALLFGNSNAQDIATKINNYTIHKGFKGSEMPVHGIEIGYIQHFGRALDLYLPFRVGPRGDVKKVQNDITTEQTMGTAAFGIALQVKYDNDRNRVVPFISTGVGSELYDDGLKYNAPIGGGFHVRILPKTFVTLSTNYNFSLSKTAPEGFCHSLGVIFNLKAPQKSAFVSKKPVQSMRSSESYAQLEAEERAKREADELARITERNRIKALAEAEAQSKIENEARAKNIAETERRAQLESAKPIEVSMAVKKVLDSALKSVQFETGSALLTQESYPALDNLAATMMQNLNLRIRIEGHTDRTGNESVNQKLSESRAKACRDYLISKGVNPARFQENGFGSMRPVSDNNTPEGRYQNRRVEFIPF